MVSVRERRKTIRKRLTAWPTTDVRHDGRVGHPNRGVTVSYRHVSGWRVEASEGCPTSARAGAVHDGSGVGESYVTGV